ncbi:hypothetical protein HD553DRAFT_314133 [Filobasidium floriforme]|uniref:uncharacterized protein n=1 Tax=Filobasidium floriforme TaxID=5210 RepID=UPI001E8E23EA|nr:uncharacterized protein HD553DRAFT_314133 [Filobasidium floriforme]KAH8082750.1 hypothetical protein HD553DRAFT_314133 [Filobasidium floriforme]
MDFLKASTLTIPHPTHSGTLSIPAPVTSTHHHHHHKPTALPPPYPEGPSAHIVHVHDTGKKALWVFWAIFTVSFLVVLLMAKRVERKLRLFHLLTATILGMAMISYLAMASGMGVALQRQFENAADGSRVLRQVFYARYIDWSLTTPLLLLDLALLSGMPLITTAVLILADIAMILTGLFAALNSSSEKTRWLMYAVSCAFYLYVLFTLIFSGRNAAKLQSAGVQRVYNVTALMIIVLWTGYPIVFGLTEGKGRLSVDTEIILYGILDVLAKVVFGFYLLLAHSHTEGDSVVLSGFFTEPRNAGQGYGAINQDDD